MFYGTDSVRGVTKCLFLLTQLKNKYGESSLVVAIRAARADMVRLLLSLGADPLLESDAGAPLDLAR